VQPQGTLQLQPVSDAVYELHFSSQYGGFISTPLNVTVNLPIAPIRRCTSKGECFDDFVDCFFFGGACPHQVTINANTLGPLLVQALGTPNTTVIVKDGVELDLTPYFLCAFSPTPYPICSPVGGPISIKDGVQLIGERIAEPGKRFQRRPLLFVTRDLWNLSAAAFDNHCWSHTTYSACSGLMAITCASAAYASRDRERRQMGGEILLPGPSVLTQITVRRDTPVQSPSRNNRATTNRGRTQPSVAGLDQHLREQAQ